ncbi:STM4014 family protein [Prosthecobacter sp.]|uniref:STM4014 family protein n=1 Tax=Prosthecobacter sp. TaxID=1965333 RepID=UPI0037839942
MPFFCLWNPESPRAVSFTGAVLERTGQFPDSLAWIDFLNGSSLPPSQEGLIVRIDSPGKNWPVEKALLARGLTHVRHDWLEINTEDLAEDPGRIIASHQYHQGFCHALRQLDDHFQNVRWMQHPADITVMNDKAACHARLYAAGVRVPPALGVPRDFDDLLARMDAAGKNRVFLKLCHGSSASGTVALERSAGRMQAFSTAKMSPGGPHGTLLHNWRAITRYENLRDIRRLVDAVCRHHSHAEVWVPKSGWQGRRFDVRIVVIAGRARHVVARLSEGPFTNLQFGARRASAEDLRAHLGAAAFTAMCAQAEHAMACFPRSLYGGVDVLIDAHKHLPHVLEVNAFGDLLPGVLHEGRDTYDWEVAHVSTTGT